LHRLPCVILRTSRFFPEPDDDRSIREGYDDLNAKVNEFLYRRVDVEDVVSAHLLAMTKGRDIGFGRYIVSATSPFVPTDLGELRRKAPGVVRRYAPQYEAVYAERGWSMFPGIDRVYVNQCARRELGWRPRYDFAHVVDQLHAEQAPGSALARSVGSKGYHAGVFADGPYPVE
jgi:nucleoside-diphosphate-sugar epimerase